MNKSNIEQRKNMPKTMGSSNLQSSNAGPIQPIRPGKSNTLTIVYTYQEDLHTYSLDFDENYNIKNQPKDRKSV